MKRVVPQVKIKKYYPGHVSTTKVHLLKYAKVSVPTLYDTASTSLLVTDPVPDACEHEDTEADQASSTNTRYYHYRKKALAEWSNVRDSIIDTLLANAYPSSFVCTACGDEEEDIIRCSDCGPSVYMCAQCAADSHLLKPFHLLHQWKECMFQVWNRPLPVVTAAHPHRSDCIKHLQTMLIFDSIGRLHTVMVQLCTCESAVLTLLRSNLWPASAERPQVAYNIELLLTMESLLLECHVSVKGFCEALATRYNFSKTRARDLYRLLVNESFEEFRHAQFRLRTFQPDDIPSRLKLCPLCPKTNRIISMDANFGLVHKKSAGHSLEMPKHGDRMFIPCGDVEQFLENRGQDVSSQESDGSCSNFQAGSRIRAKNRSAKLDVKAVFGSVCRHEIPVRFLDMKHGERLVYPELLVKSILEPGERLHLTYDIACLFNKYLQKSEDGRTLQQSLTLAVPVFHCYGHQMSCQVNYSSRRIVGFANVDGEAIERLWSYLRGFSPITKEMTLTHRTDLLTDALLYFGKKKVQKLGDWLVGRLTDAKKQLVVCGEGITKISQQYHTTITPVIMEEWKNQQEELPLTSRRKPDPTWEESYVTELERAAKIRKETLSGTSTLPQDTLESQSKELEKKLKKIEKSHKVTSRWAQTESLYRVHLSSIVAKRTKILLQEMHTMAQERMFLLALKQKYAVGQAISVRICGQINRTSKKTKTLLKRLNNNGFLADGQPLTEESAFNPSSEVYQIAGCQVNSGIPWTVRKEVLDLHFRQQRLCEEVLFGPTMLSDV